MIRIRELRISPRSSRAATRDPLLEIPELDIHSDEYVVIAGPNGAGKSLLLLTIAGLRAPDHGSVTFDHANVEPALGIVFQSPDDQIVGSTVERDLAFGLENRAVPSAEIRVRVDSALAWSGLEAVARRPPHQLSEGEKQRLALASALILEPEVLLLDEPTARLDPAGRATFRRELRRVRERPGVTVGLVTHRSPEVMEADRVLGLREGRVVFDGTPGELLRSGERARLGILWSGPHRLRAELGRRGAWPPDPADGDWNSIPALAAALAGPIARASARSTDPPARPEDRS